MSKLYKNYSINLATATDNLRVLCVSPKNCILSWVDSSNAKSIIKIVTTNPSTGLSGTVKTVSSPISGYSMYGPELTPNNKGGYILCWTQDGQYEKWSWGYPRHYYDKNSFCGIYNANHQLDVFEKRLLSEGEQNYQYNTHASMLSNHRIGVVFQSVPISNGNKRIAYKIYNANNEVLLTDRIESSSNSDQPYISSANNGTALVSWQTGGQIKARSIDKSGYDHKSTFLVSNKGSEHIQISVKNENILFVWTKDNGSANKDIMARVVTLSGYTIVPTFQVNTESIGNQHSPQAVYTNSGVSIFWVSDHAPGVYMRSYSNTMTPRGKECLISEIDAAYLTKFSYAVSPHIENIAILWKQKNKRQDEILIGLLNSAVCHQTATFSHTKTISNTTEISETKTLSPSDSHNATSMSETLSQSQSNSSTQSSSGSHSKSHNTPTNSETSSQSQSNSSTQSLSGSHSKSHNTPTTSETSSHVISGSESSEVSGSTSMSSTSSKSHSPSISVSASKSNSITNTGDITQSETISLGCAERMNDVKSINIEYKDIRLSGDPHINYDNKYTKKEVSIFHNHKSTPSSYFYKHVIEQPVKISADNHWTDFRDNKLITNGHIKYLPDCYSLDNLGLNSNRGKGKVSHYDLYYKNPENIDCLKNTIVEKHGEEKVDATHGVKVTTTVSFFKGVAVNGTLEGILSGLNKFDNPLKGDALITAGNCILKYGTLQTLLNNDKQILFSSNRTFYYDLKDTVETRVEDFNDRLVPTHAKLTHMLTDVNALASLGRTNPVTKHTNSTDTNHKKYGSIESDDKNVLKIPVCTTISELNNNIDAKEVSNIKTLDVSFQLGDVRTDSAKFLSNFAFEELSYDGFQRPGVVCYNKNLGNTHSSTLVPGQCIKKSVIAEITQEGFSVGVKSYFTASTENGLRVCNDGLLELSNHTIKPKNFVLEDECTVSYNQTVTLLQEVVGDVTTITQDCGN